MLIVTAAVMGSSPSDGLARSAMPLRLEARKATFLYSDGDRYVVIEGRRDVLVVDTLTGERLPLPHRCGVGTVAHNQTHLAVGRAILRCGDAQYVAELRSSRRTPLPKRVTVDGVEHDTVFHRLGKWWAETPLSHACGPFHGPFCDGYVNFRTGEQRIVPRDPRGTFRDLDDPQLRRRTLCRPHADAFRDGQRTYEAPYLLAGGIPYRCGSRHRLRNLPSAFPDLMNLSAGLASWGNPFSGGDGRVYLFDFSRRRLSSWRVPRVGSSRSTPGTAVHTRRRLFVAATLTTNDEGDPLTIRVYSARLP